MTFAKTADVIDRVLDEGQFFYDTERKKQKGELKMARITITLQNQDEANRLAAILEAGLEVVKKQ